MGTGEVLEDLRAIKSLLDRVRLSRDIAAVATPEVKQIQHDAMIWSAKLHEIIGSRRW